MSRPNTLRNDYQGYSSTFGEQVLTPRTPHSRAGRAEEGRFASEEYDQEGAQDDSYDSQYAGYSAHQQQRAPLLVSSASDTFPQQTGSNANWKGKGKQTAGLTADLILSRLPLLGGLASALFLLFLVVMSVEKPESLHGYLHPANSTLIPGVSQIVDEASTLVTIPAAISTPTLAAEPETETETPPMGMDMNTKLSYAQYTSFALQPSEYVVECVKVQKAMTGPMGTYWYIPPGGPLDVVHPDENPNSQSEAEGEQEKKICTSSITYMLDGYVGLAADLAIMAQAAGLAREQNRTFFVNDQFWNRGRWADHFADVRELQPGPEPGCLPPPPEELVACPRTARHWVVSSRTALFHFGHGFQDEFENPYARELRRLKPIFTRAALSLSNTIQPSATSAGLISRARQALAPLGPYVAVHIRRGDRKPEAWRYHGQPIPVADYAKAVSESVERLGLWPGDKGETESVAVYVASDDPTSRAEFANALAEVVDAAKVVSLESTGDETLAVLASEEAYVQSEFNEREEAERVRLTRGALVDFAMVTGLWADEQEGETGPEAVVCMLNSNFCKLAAVGLGWDRAFGFAPGDPDTSVMGMDDAAKRWVEIDNAGNIIPVWRALEMFMS